MSALTFIYADPPYIGKSWRYDHPEATRWDNPCEHIELMHNMDDAVDGWALSANGTTLRQLLPASPAGTRVGVCVPRYRGHRPHRRGDDAVTGMEPPIDSDAAPPRSNRGGHDPGGAGSDVRVPIVCPWCRDGSHAECIENADPYGPDCECDHAE